MKKIATTICLLSAFQANAHCERDRRDHEERCRSHRGRYHCDEHRTYREVLNNRSFVLNGYGATQYFSVGGDYIKMLTITAEGTNRRGGELDLYINGDFERNLIVPGRDPVYRTAINRRVHSIELYRRNGSVRVYKVEALFGAEGWETHRRDNFWHD